MMEQKISKSIILSYSPPPGSINGLSAFNWRKLNSYRYLLHHVDFKSVKVIENGIMHENLPPAFQYTATFILIYQMRFYEFYWYLRYLEMELLFLLR